MAINKIAGETLESNLIRETDLSFNDTLLHLDVTNGRIGIGTSSPGNFKLDVTGNARITGNQTITGDLVVQGTTTTIDSQNLVVEDNIITINENASGATDAGIMINRTAANNALFIWDETVDKFRFGTTTQDGSTVELHSWLNGDNGISVVHYKVMGGGHSYPNLNPSSSKEYENGDIDSNSEIWNFLSRYDINGLR